MLQWKFLHTCSISGVGTLDTNQQGHAGFEGVWGAALVFVHSTSLPWHTCYFASIAGGELVRFPNPLVLGRASESENLTRGECAAVVFEHSTSLPSHTCTLQLRRVCSCGHGVDSPGCRCCMACPLLLLLLLALLALLLLALPCTAAAIATSCCWHCSELLLSLLAGPPALHRTGCCCCLKSPHFTL